MSALKVKHKVSSVTFWELLRRIFLAGVNTTSSSEKARRVIATNICAFGLGALAIPYAPVLCWYSSPWLGLSVLIFPVIHGFEIWLNSKERYNLSRTILLFTISVSICILGAICIENDPSTLRLLILSIFPLPILLFSQSEEKYAVISFIPILVAFFVPYIFRDLIPDLPQEFFPKELTAWGSAAGGLSMIGIQLISVRQFFLQSHSAEQSLEKHMQRLGSHARKSHLAFLEFNKEGNILTLNPAAEGILLAAHAFKTGSDFFLSDDVLLLDAELDVVTLENQEKFKEFSLSKQGVIAIQNSTTGKISEFYEYRNTDLSTREDEHQNEAMIASIMQNITKHIDEKINAEHIERLNSETFLKGGIGLFHISKNGTFLRVNPAFAKFLDISPALQDTSKSIFDFLGANDARRLKEIISDLQNGKLETTQIEQSYKLKNQTIRSALVSLTAFRSQTDAGSMVRNQFLREQSQEIFIAGAVQDLSEQHKLRTELSQIHNALDAAAGVAEISPDTNLLFVNEKFKTMLNLRNDESFFGAHNSPETSSSNVKSAKQNFPIVPYTSQGASFLQEAIENAKHNLLIVDEVRFDKPEGAAPVWAQAVATPVSDASGKIQKILMLFFDISNMKKQQLELEEERAKAVAAAKLVALGEMAAGIAHEINNPLAVIHGKARVSRKKFAEQHEVVKTFEEIEQFCDRIGKIIRGLRTFARDGEQDPLIPCKLTDLVDDAIAVCQNRFQKAGIILRIANSAPNAVINARGVQIAQVILNLLGNAIDSLQEMPQQYNKKEVVVSVRAEAGAHSGWVELSIEDNGPGIPKHLHAKILQPFFTTKPVGKGTGLGLSISLGIVNSHGGTLRIAENEVGAKFVVTFPVLETEVT